MKKDTGFVDSSDARLYFEQVGSGPGVLFVHAGVADLRMWDSQVDVLQEEFKCVRLDMRGFGQTENRAETFFPSSDVAAILDHVHLDDAHLVGASMGGSIALEFALDQPQRVRSLSLVAAGVGGWDKPPKASELAEMAEAEKAFEEKDWDRGVELDVRYWLDGPGRGGRIQGPVRELMIQMGRGACGREEVVARPTPLDPAAITRLSEIETPTLILVGTFDESSILEIADLLSEQIPNATKIVYEGVAHMINLEQPEQFNSDLLSFLRSH